MKRQLRAHRQRKSSVVSHQGVLALFEVQSLENRRLLSAAVIANVLKIQGTTGDDVIAISAGANPGEVTLTGVDGVIDGTVMTGIDQIVIEALAGNDNVTVGDGILDTLGFSIGIVIDGGAGNDTLTGGDGDETFIGGAGSDTIDGGGGVNTIDFSNVTKGGVKVDLSQGSVSKDGFGGKDTLANIQNVVGSAKSDQITGDDNNNDLDGGAGNDKLNGLGGDDTLNGGLGNDHVTGSAGDDMISGDNGNDKLSGDDDDDVIWGGTGNDNISGGLGNDTLLGEAGNDKISGDDGDDTLEGQSDNDSIKGGRGNDDLGGGLGDDKLSGDDGDDDIDGGSGKNKLDGGLGDDQLHGHKGTDKFKDKDEDSFDSGADDENGPSADVIGKTLTLSGDSLTATFKVVYSDPEGIDLTTLDVNDVTVLTEGASVVVVDASVDSSGANPIVTYTIAKEDQTAFTSADNGEYLVVVNADEVENLIGVAAESDDIGEPRLGTGNDDNDDNDDNDEDGLTELKSDNVQIDDGATTGAVLMEVNVVLDASSVSAANFTVTAPDGTTVLPITGVNVIQKDDETKILVSFGLPGGATFSAANDGTYHLVVTSSSFKTQGGEAVIGADLDTTFTVTVQ